MINKIVFISISLLFSISPLFSQNDEIKLLSIGKALEYSYENNPSLNILKSKTEETDNLWKTKTGISQPEISYTREGLGNTDQYFEQRLSVTQSLDKPLQIFNQAKAAKYDQKALRLEIETHKLKLKESVKIRYVLLLHALYYDNLMQDRIKLSDDLQKAVQIKYDNGSADKMELINAKLRYQKSMNQKNETEARVHRYRYRLFELCGIDPENQKYEIEFSDTLKTYEPEISQDSALKSLENHPEYEMYVQKKKSAEQNLKAAKKGYFPSVSFSYYQQDFSQGYNFNGFEVGVGIPLWGAFDSRAEVKVNQSRVLQSEFSTHKKLLELKKDIEEAWHSYEKARKIINRYNDSQKEQSYDLLKMTQEAYKLGEISFIKLIDAQDLYLNNQEIYLNALKDYYIYLIKLEKFTEKELVF